MSKVLLLHKLSEPLYTLAAAMVCSRLGADSSVVREVDGICGDDSLPPL
jgi:hypothetical protein